MNMRRLALFALAALALAACDKATPADSVPAAPGKHIETVRCGISGTRTAYDEAGKFSWVQGDVVGLLYSNGENMVQYPFVAASSGAETEFTGEVEDGYTPVGVATYPFNLEVDGYACNAFAYNVLEANEGFRLWGSIKPDKENPLSCVPMSAVVVEDGLYQFRTATGILHFTVKNAPAEMYFSYLETPAESDAFLNGWFNLAEDGSVRMENAMENSGYRERYNWNVPDEPNQTMDIWFFVPVGTLPAGTKFEICNEEWAPIATFPFQRDVEVVRNAVIEFEPVEVQIVHTEEVVLTVDMIAASDICTHDGDGVPALVDNNPATYWHSNWYYPVDKNDPVFGVYFDITLSSPVDAFLFKYQVRAENNNAAPTKVVYGVSEDGVNWEAVLSVEEGLDGAAAGQWVSLPSVNLEKGYRYLRLGITDSRSQDQGSLTGDLSFTDYKKCVNLAELKLFRLD